MAVAVQCVLYDLDREDRLAAVSGAWDHFARENGAPELCGSRVLGRSLWDFVCGADVRHWNEVLLHGVRGHGRPVAVPFRCDAPDRERRMEMQVTPLKGGG